MHRRDGSFVGARRTPPRRALPPPPAWGPQASAPHVAHRGRYTAAAHPAPLTVALAPDNRQEALTPHHLAPCWHVRPGARACGKEIPSPPRRHRRHHHPTAAASLSERRRARPNAHPSARLHARGPGHVSRGHLRPHGFATVFVPPAFARHARRPTANG